MDDGAVFPRAGNGGEAFAAEVRQAFAEAEQMGGGGEFSFVPCAPVGGEPVQEAAHGHAVAQVGVARALLLDLVFAGLGEQDGGGAFGDAGARGAKVLEEPCRCVAGIETDRFTRQPVERSRQGGAVGDRDRVAEPLACCFVQLCRWHE